MVQSILVSLVSYWHCSIMKNGTVPLGTIPTVLKALVGMFYITLWEARTATTTKTRRTNNLSHMYRVEETSACDVAYLSGMMIDSTSVLYPSHQEIIKSQCEPLEVGWNC